MMKVRKSGGEEIPLIQGKGQRLRFAGAAMNRYPEPKERETQVYLENKAESERTCKDHI